MGSLVGCINEPRPTLKIPSAERRKEPLSTREKVGVSPYGERESLSPFSSSLCWVQVYPERRKEESPVHVYPEPWQLRALLTYCLSLCAIVPGIKGCYYSFMHSIAACLIEAEKQKDGRVGRQ